jgi:hypothetical protein
MKLRKTSESAIQLVFLVMNLMVLYRKNAKAFLLPSWKPCLSWSGKGSQRKTSSQWLHEMVRGGFFSGTPK